MKRHRWAGTLNEKRGKPTAKNCRMRSKTRKLVKEVPGLIPKVRYAEGVDRVHTSRIPGEEISPFIRHFSSQVKKCLLIVNSGFRKRRRWISTLEQRKPYQPAACPLHLAGRHRIQNHRRK